MIIEERHVTIRDLTADYEDDEVEGVTGYSGRLDIRPKYQREYVYTGRRQAEVIRSVMKGFPINIMYWAVTGDDSYEVLDGQQRTISICRYVDGDFSVKDEAGNDMLFWNLPSDKQAAILDYEVTVYVCDGTESEKLDWFKIVNIGGLELSAQELRNAVYAGPWVSDAKRYFSKPNGGAVTLADRYVKGEAIRQDILETAIRWAASAEGESIERYMGEHAKDPTAQALWSYFRSVIEWVQAVFPKYRSQMRGIEWGLLYNEHGKRTDLDPAKLEVEVSRLMADEDVTSKKGVYEYLLTGEERRLSIRAFDQRGARAAYERQKGMCPYCGEHFEFEEMQADHIVPWSKGGRTVPENCQMLCRDCNLKKSDK